MIEERRPDPSTRDRPATDRSTGADDTSEPAAPEPATRPPAAPPETSEHPAPGVHHEPEPDADNIMPAEDGPGTF